MTDDSVNIGEFIKRELNGSRGKTEFFYTVREYLRGKLVIDDEIIETPKSKSNRKGGPLSPIYGSNRLYDKNLPSEYDPYWVGLAWALYDGRKEIGGAFTAKGVEVKARVELLKLAKSDALRLFDKLHKGWVKYEKTFGDPKKGENPKNDKTEKSQKIGNTIKLPNGKIVNLHPPELHIVTMSRPLIEGQGMPTQHNFSIGIFKVALFATNRGSYKKRNWKAYTLTDDPTSEWKFKHSHSKNTYKWGSRGKVWMDGFLFTDDHIFVSYGSGVKDSNNSRPGWAFLERDPANGRELYKGRYHAQIRGKDHASEHLDQSFGGEVFFLRISPKEYARFVSLRKSEANFKEFVKEHLGKIIYDFEWHLNNYKWV